MPFASHAVFGIAGGLASLLGVSVAIYFYRKQRKPSGPPKVKSKQELIEEVCSSLVLSDEQITEVSRKLLHCIKQGLLKSTHSSSSIKCFPTFVRELPNGKETGKFLALDLGGTNFRVLLIELGPGGKFLMESKIFAVPQRIMLGSGTGLFDHIAECMAHFMKEHGVYREQLPLGFTFSFPCKQEGLTRARLVQWTKGFRCSGVESQDVVQLLREAVARRGDIGIDVLAVLNDTTGCLMSTAWRESTTFVGVIVGTGTNACYMEELDNVELVQDLPEVNEEGPSQMVVNTEWGAFGDNGELEFIRTEYDHEIDRNSINKGRQLYEKMISGMYMGELARLALVRLVKMNLIFEGQGSEQLFERGSFATKYISEIEDDKPGEYHNCMQVLEELALDATEEDCASVRYVCECVSRRAAYLVSAGIATLLNKMKRPKVTVAVDGSVYRFHPHFHDLMTAKISQLLKPGIKFELMLSEDGSGRGAALVAAVACRIALQQAEQQSSASS